MNKFRCLTELYRHRKYGREKLHECLAGLENVFCVADDVILFGYGDTYDEAQRDHDANLRALLRRCIERSIRLSLKFVGHKLTIHGLRRDPSKVDAIMKMPC